MILNLDNNKYETTWAQKRTMLIRLTYSNNAEGYKNARKNNDTEQLENNKKVHS